MLTTFVSEHFITQNTLTQKVYWIDCACATLQCKAEKLIAISAVCCFFCCFFGHFQCTKLKLNWNEIIDLDFIYSLYILLQEKKCTSVLPSSVLPQDPRSHPHFTSSGQQSFGKKSLCSLTSAVFCRYLQTSSIPCVQEKHLITNFRNSSEMWRNISTFHFLSFHNSV